MAQCREPNLSTRRLSWRVACTRRCVPLRPDVVRHLLHTEKKFTTDADKEVVADLYESFFNDVAGSSTELDFPHLCWTDQAIRDLARSLRL